MTKASFGYVSQEGGRRKSKRGMMCSQAYHVVMLDAPEPAGHVAFDIARDDLAFLDWQNNSLAEAAGRGAEVVLDVAGEVAEGGEVEEVGDVLEAQGAVAQLAAALGAPRVQQIAVELRVECRMQVGRDYYFIKHNSPVISL